MNGTYYLLCSQDFVHFYELQSNQFSKLQNILAGLKLCFLLLLSSSFQFYSYFGLMFLSFLDLSNLLKVANGIHFGVILQFSAFFIFFPWWVCVLSGLMQLSCHFSNLLVLFEELFCVREVKVAKSRKVV